MSVSQNYSPVRPSLSLDFANVKALDPRITFARASTGAYYDGKTVTLAEENRLKYSEEFNQATAWSTFSSATITADATTAPDGTTTADLYTVTSTTTNLLASQPALGSLTGDFTGSIYLKASTGAQWVVLRLWKGDGGYTGSSAWFDLVNGVLGSSTAINSASAGASLLGATIQSVGDGWYRVSVSGGFSSTSVLSYLAVQLVNADASAVTSGQDGNAIFVWGAQLNSGANLVGYSKTTTATVPASYIPVLQTAPANTARFDHNPVTGESLGLLVEEQRTNLLTYSESLSDASWTKINGTVAANTVIAPDGTLTGDTITATANGADIRKVASTTNTIHINSIWIKRRSGTGIVRLRNPQGQSDTDITSALTTQWQRLSSLATLPFSGSSLYMGVVLNISGDQVDVWGAQAEAGKFPTSYIPTVASQVTRSADSASMTGANFSSWYRADEGSVILHYVENGNDTSSSGVNFNDGSTANRIGFFIDGSGATPIQPTFVVVSGNSVQANIVGSAPPINTVVKTATAYDNNSFILSTNGAVIGSDVAGVVPKVTQMQIGNQLNSSFANRSIKKIAYYPARLSNENLQALTS